MEGSAFIEGENQTWLRRRTNGLEVLETREWLDSLDYVLSQGGPERAGRLLQQLSLHARRAAGVNLPFTATTPYQNTIASAAAAALSRQPGDGAPHQEPGPLECPGHGGARQQDPGRHRRAHLHFRLRRHACTKLPSITFLQAQTESGDRDIVYFQGHAAPGIYSRAYLEGRIPKEKLQNFRRELKPGGGLSSYPHPWLMPDFWEFPTVSHGTGPDPGDLSGALHSLSGKSRPEDNPPAAKSGPSWATARWTNPNRSARSRWPRAKGSTT